MKSMRTSLFKITLSLLFFLDAIALLNIYFEAKGLYELSIYAVPSLAWTLININVILGLGICVYSLISRCKNEQNLWRYAFLSIVLSSLIVLLKPMVSHYVFITRGDHLAHIGLINDLVTTGYINNTLYPLTHILVGSVSILLNQPATTIASITGQYFYLIFILLTLLLSNQLLPQKATVLTIVISSMLCCYYYNNLFPFGYSLILLPLVFFLYNKYLDQRSLGVIVCLLILLVIMPIFHPMGSFILTTFLALLEGIRITLDARRHNLSIVDLSITKIGTLFPLISFMILILWVWYSVSIWDNCISSLMSISEFGNVGSSMAQTSVGTLKLLDLNIASVIELSIRKYGSLLLFSLLSLLSIIVIAFRQDIGNDRQKQRIFLYYGCFVFAFVVWITDMIMPLTTLSSGRFIWLVIAMYPLLSGISLYSVLCPGNTEGSNLRRFLPIKSSSKYRALFVFLALTFGSLIAIYGLYASPLMHQPNLQVTEGEFECMKWLIIEGSPKDHVIGPQYTTDTRRFAYAVLGFSNLKYPPFVESTSAHFGYNGRFSIGESYASDTLMPISSFIHALYIDLWTYEKYPNLSNYNINDFLRLNHDDTLDKIYTNEDSAIWLIHGNLAS